MYTSIFENIFRKLQVDKVNNFEDMSVFAKTLS